MSDVKRLFDVAVASSVLVLGAPVIAMMSALIKLESPGPALFSQMRVGRGRKTITTLKLRTMVVDAERLGPEITADSDPRITRVGRFLRKTKLDELPQLWNVIRGEMSVIGPRPEVPKYAAFYPERLFEVRPGLTDLASLTFRDEETLLAEARDRERAYREVIMPMKLSLALEGLERTGIRDDLRVLGRTALALVRWSGKQEKAVLAEARRRIAELNRGEV